MQVVVNGETIEDINIGYYDVPSNVNLASYDSFGVDLWYAASGQGDVYNASFNAINNSSLCAFIYIRIGSIAL